MAQRWDCFGFVAHELIIFPTPSFDALDEIPLALVLSLELHQLCAELLLLAYNLHKAMYASRRQDVSLVGRPMFATNNSSENKFRMLSL